MLSRDYKINIKYFKYIYANVHAHKIHMQNNLLVNLLTKFLTDNKIGFSVSARNTSPSLSYLAISPSPPYRHTLNFPSCPISEIHSEVEKKS